MSHPACMFHLPGIPESAQIDDDSLNLHFLEKLNKMSENSLLSFSSNLKSSTLSSPGKVGVGDSFTLAVPLTQPPPAPAPPLKGLGIGESWGILRAQEVCALLGWESTAWSPWHCWALAVCWTASSKEVGVTLRIVGTALRASVQRKSARPMIEVDLLVVYVEPHFQGWALCIWRWASDGQAVIFACVLCPRFDN